MQATSFIFENYGGPNTFRLAKEIAKRSPKLDSQRKIFAKEVLDEFSELSKNWSNVGDIPFRDDLEDLIASKLSQERWVRYSVPHQPKPEEMI